MIKPKMNYSGIPFPVCWVTWGMDLPSQISYFKITLDEIKEWNKLNS